MTDDACGGPARPTTVRRRRRGAAARGAPLRRPGDRRPGRQGDRRLGRVHPGAGAALPTLPADTELELTLDPTASGMGEAVYAVSVMPVGGRQLHAYAVSNAMLPPEHRLARTAVGELVALGWSPPGVVPGAAERFGLQLPAEQAGRLAAIVSRTLREIYGTPAPGVPALHGARRRTAARSRRRRWARPARCRPTPTRWTCRAAATSTRCRCGRR